jgi:hypothetical protein
MPGRDLNADGSVDVLGTQLERSDRVVDRSELVRPRSAGGSKRETPDQILCAFQSRTKANRRRYEEPPLDNPALSEPTRRAGPTLIAPNAERDAQNFPGIFGRSCGLLPESASVSLDKAARIQPCDARSRRRRKIALRQFRKPIWIAAKLCLRFIE